MGDTHELYTKAATKDTEGKLCDITCQLLERIKSHHPQIYEETVQQLESIVYAIPREDAEVIVKRMEPRGQQWTYDAVKSYLSAKGIMKDYVNYYLVMNMVYNDFYNTAASFGMQKNTDFYYSLAKDFIEDVDAKPFKVEKYFLS